MKKYITEFIGRFFLLLAIVMSGDAIVVGSVLMVIVYAGGHISGAHYNPAVTLAFFIRGKLNIKEVTSYIIAQLTGAIAAVFLALWLSDKPVIPFYILEDKILHAIVAEITGTFILVFVILNVATAKGTAGNSFYGLAIGVTVYAVSMVFGKISGGAFNPAAAFGLSVIKTFDWNSIWIYLAGCFGGAALAALIFRIVNPENK